MNHVLWYVNGYCWVNQNSLIAVTHWFERTDFGQVGSLVLFNQNMPKSTTGFSHAPLETAFILHHGNTAWSPWLFQLPVIIALNFTCSKVILSGDFYRRNAADPPARVQPLWDTRILSPPAREVGILKNHLSCTVGVFKPKTVDIFLTSTRKSMLCLPINSTSSTQKNLWVLISRAFDIICAENRKIFVWVQSNLDSSNTDGSFTMANSIWFSST